MTKYISKGEWFDKGTEAKLLFQYIWRRGTNNGKDEGTDDVGLFEGIKDGKLDEEGCGFDEFDIIDIIEDHDDGHPNSYYNNKSRKEFN
jgi:hypothetical protein